MPYKRHHLTGRELSGLELRAVLGRGFNHEIIDDHSATGKPVACVYVDLLGDEDLGWELCKLFAASINLLFALDDTDPDHIALKPFQHLLEDRP